MRLKKGKITVFVVQGEYQGKKTYSYTIEKSFLDKDTKEWKKSPFFSVADLQDLSAITSEIIAKAVKHEKVEPKKPEPEKPQEEFADPGDSW